MKLKLAALVATALVSSSLIPVTTYAPVEETKPATFVLSLYQLMDKIRTTSSNGRKRVVQASSLPSRGQTTHREVNRAQTADYKVIRVEATGYTLGEESTGKRPGDKGYGVTASGRKVNGNQLVIAAPSHIPFGTVIDVPGYGKGVVLDRGGAIKVKKDGTTIIDLLFPTVEDAKQWGRKRNLEVRVYR